MRPDAGNQKRSKSFSKFQEVRGESQHPWPCYGGYYGIGTTLRFPADLPKHFGGLLFFLVNQTEDVFLIKALFETLESFPQKWKGICNGLFCSFYCACILVKVSKTL